MKGALTVPTVSAPAPPLRLMAPDRDWQPSSCLGSDAPFTVGIDPPPYGRGAVARPWFPIRSGPSAAPDSPPGLRCQTLRAQSDGNGQIVQCMTVPCQGIRNGSCAVSIASGRIQRERGE